MPKRSLIRRHKQYEKDQLGCMGGLISIFDFRRGRSTQRLLSDRRRGSNHAFGAGSHRDKLDMLTCYNENSPETDGKERATARKPSVKKLIEEEMSSDQDIEKETNNTEVESKQPDSECGGRKMKNRKRIKKTRKKSCDNTHDPDAAENLASECPFHQNTEPQQSTQTLDIEKIIEFFCHQMRQNTIDSVKQDRYAEILLQSNEKNPDIAEQSSEAIKLLINQQLLDRKYLADDGEIHPTKELMDALQILISDDDLFLKLLQDSNSQDTMVEKDEGTKSLVRSNMSKGELSSLVQSDKLVNRKHHNFFRRKAKSRERNLSKEGEMSQPSNRIVILKPLPTGLCNLEPESSLSLDSDSHKIITKEPNERVGSHFFLTEIKRRLKSAMGKEQHRIFSDGNSRISYSEHQISRNGVILKEKFGRNSTTKDRFFIERISRPSNRVKKGEKIDKLKGQGMEHETADKPSETVSNIYIEAKKHLSDMLRNGDEDVVNLDRQDPKTLGRILSLPDYNSSPVGSPGRNWKRSFLTAQMRFSASEKIRNGNGSVWSFKQDNHADQTTQESKPKQCVSDDTAYRQVQVLDSNSNTAEDEILGNDVGKKCCSIVDKMSSEVEVSDIVVEEESNVLDAPSELCLSPMAEDDENGDTSEVFDKQKYSECLKEESCEEKPLPSSPLASPSNSTNKAEDHGSAVDIPERTSPVSVLEPLFTEDDISPPSTRSQSVEMQVQPLRLRIQFEELDSLASEEGFLTNTCVGDNEAIFEYVKSVLHASGFSWDELYMKSLSSYQLLDPSLTDQVEFLPNQLCYDQKLLFDCINEVLMEVCGHYIGCSHWVSFVKPQIRPIPCMKNAIREVWEGVVWYIIPLPLPRTLDQIVRKDLAKSGTWMDLRFDAESIGFEMEEAILDELMEDTVLSCVYHNVENGCPVLLAALEENESIINL
ncbi:DUF3741 domain-containing protein/DUF4378 domain-containing protein [Cephalotus follicularis]|uniref:DUF3741 domain-containing protein/DUF4378 domain-containing protein n=1 Tax=Cephalotus follicularis TaxID=3775 RepID=A0A1Q3CNJ4_CEPFO|nr:DUF3741 domain-containing protein/DUF4378 domain-containing protein [Cephalotus follicularis]